MTESHLKNIVSLVFQVRRHFPEIKLLLLRVYLIGLQFPIESEESKERREIKVTLGPNSHLSPYRSSKSHEGNFRDLFYDE